MSWTTGFMFRTALLLLLASSGCSTAREYVLTRREEPQNHQTAAVASATGLAAAEGSPSAEAERNNSIPPESAEEETPRESTDSPESAALPEQSTDGDLTFDDDPEGVDTTERSSIRQVAARRLIQQDDPAYPLQTDDEIAPQVPESPEGATEPVAEPAGTESVQLESVVDSVYQSYPLLISAFFSRNIALGQQISASGAFDTKLKGASENGPTGFYQTYRQSLGVVQPTMWGGELFAGYRVGRGDFQPWYLERQTNDGGEFKAGVLVPLARNRDIDQRRAELWKAVYGRQIVEPDIQAQLIGFVQEASYAYWFWIAAGENHRIATRILELASERTGRIEQQVKADLVDPPELTDNLRLVAIREAKVADTLRKLQQTAVKLSVYLRDASGQPYVPTFEQSPGFPEPQPLSDDQLQTDIQIALSARPELRYLDLLRRQIDIDYSEATNQLQPEVNAMILGSQDMGQPTSSKRDKSPFEGEASIYLDVPIQRRKALGKLTELEGKVAQLNAKRRITGDKIVIDVQSAWAGLVSAIEQVRLTREAVERAEDLANRERQLQAAGASDLLKVALREQYAVESAEKQVEALLLYYVAQADYRAALAQDQVP